MVTRRLALGDQEEAVHLFGPQDKNLKEVERRFGVQVFVRPNAEPGLGGLTLAIRGRPRSVEQAVALLGEMKRTLTYKDRQGTVPVNVPTPGVPGEGRPDKDVVYVTVTGRAIRPLTAQQKIYVHSLLQNDMTIGIGPAGTGKTFLAVACAVATLEMGKVSRIVLTRPIVEAGERLGFLPGDFYEKVHPYLKPLYDAFYSMVGADKFRLMRDEETIEIIPLAYMRGRTLDNCYVILDEAQNTTAEQMKMFLTRLGTGSRMAVTGDITQIDLDRKIVSGLVSAEQILKNVEGISFVRFGETDVMRHPLVKKVLRAYDEWERRPAP